MTGVTSTAVSGPSPAAASSRPMALAPILGLCLVGLLVAMTLAIALGSVSLSPIDVWSAVLDRISGHPQSSVADQIVWGLRLPRVLLAALVGASLAISGAVMQVLVRNVLADPFLLGVSSGASVGATSVMLFGLLGGLGLWAMAAGSIIGSLVAMVLVFMLARVGGGMNATQLVLSGVILSALFQAITSFLIFKGDPNATQGVLFWLLGSFGLASWEQLWIPAVALGGSLVYLLLQRRALNALAMGEGAASSLGIDIHPFRRALFLIASLTAGATVAVAGVVGFIGLVVPHIVRLAVGADHKRVLPVCVFIGAIFTVLADLLARTVVSPQEMPMGVISAFVGAPLLLLLIRRGARLSGVGG